MFFNPPLTTRPITVADRDWVMPFINTAPQVHAHLDWRPVEDWLGTQPFLVAEQGQRVVGALVCPPDPADTAWVRLLALAGDARPQRVWQALWPPARSALETLGVKTIAGLSLDGWMNALYKSSDFELTHHVVVLELRLPISIETIASPVRIRVAQADDHPAIVAADWGAFVSPWQISPNIIRQAITQADYLTVAELDGAIVGYQLTTPNPDGAHLARLAVLPPWQGRGIGQALVADLLQHYTQRGARKISVNTQDTNQASLAVYQRTGFKLNGIKFPVYQIML